MCSWLGTTYCYVKSDSMSSSCCRLCWTNTGSHCWPFSRSLYMYSQLHTYHYLPCRHKSKFWRGDNRGLLITCWIRPPSLFWFPALLNSKREPKECELEEQELRQLPLMGLEEPFSTTRCWWWCLCFFVFFFLERIIMESLAVTSC